MLSGILSPIFWNEDFIHALAMQVFVFCLFLSGLPIMHFPSLCIFITLASRLGSMPCIAIHKFLQTVNPLTTNITVSSLEEKYSKFSSI